MKPSGLLLRRALLAAALLPLGSGAAGAQNLVVNGGFEDYTACPGFLGQVTGYLTDWYRTGLGSTDYHHVCGFNTHASRTGDGHLGLIPFDSSPDYREYATGRLSEPLSAGQTYRLEFWVILSEGRLHAIQEMSAYFSAAPPSFSGSAPPPGIVPQVVHSGGTLEDKVDWMLVSESFVAAGGEEYITLGNFFTDAETTNVFFGCCGQHGAYYHLDDVSLVLESSQPSVAVSCALVGDRCAEDPAIDGDGALDFGEQVDFEIRVENTGTLDLTGWSALLDVAGAEPVDPADGRLAIASLPVGDSAVLPVTLRIPLPEEGSACGEPVVLTLREQAADGGFSFPDEELSDCGAVVDGCQECRATCLHRADVTSLRPFVPDPALIFQDRDSRDVALIDAEYACPFADGELEPDPSALDDGVALVLYQVDRPIGSLRLAKSGRTILFRF